MDKYKFSLITVIGHYKLRLQSLKLQTQLKLLKYLSVSGFFTTLYHAETVGKLMAFKNLLKKRYLSATVNAFENGPDVAVFKLYCFS